MGDRDREREIERERERERDLAEAGPRHWRFFFVVGPELSESESVL